MIVQTVSADAFVALSSQIDGVPSFEDCQVYDSLPANTKVKPVAGDTCKKPISYGYTRGNVFYRGSELRVLVYWPQTKGTGEWPVSQLIF